MRWLAFAGVLDPRKSLLWPAAICAVALAFSIHAQDKKPPAAKPPREFTDRDLRELDGEATRSRTAKEGLQLYKQVVDGRKLSDKHREQLEARIKLWTKRIDEGLVRVGADWVTPQAAEELRKKADALIAQANKQIAAGEYKAAKDLLENASEVDPAGARADFLLGLMNSPNYWNYAPGAQKHFENAYRREPENNALANNLALSRIKMGRFPEAVDLWQSALRREGEASAIVHNLGRLAKDAEAKRLGATKTTYERAAKLHDKAVAANQLEASNPKVGWLYSRFGDDVPPVPAEKLRAGSLGVAGKKFNVFEDRTCPACKGRKKVPCPVKGCNRGSVTEFEETWQVVTAVEQTQAVLRGQKARAKACPGCGGSGVADCKHCTDGSDPRLK